MTSPLAHTTTVLFVSFLSCSHLLSYTRTHAHSHFLLSCSHPFAFTQTMYSTILAGSSSNNYDGYNDITPPPPPLPSLPLYLRFVLSKQTHLSTLSTQQQQENIIYLDHGFQLALFLHSDDNRSNYSYNHSHNQDRDKHSDGHDVDQQPLSQSTTVVDSDTTATITTTPTIVHTPLSDTTKPPGLYSKERIDIDNNVFSDFFQHAAAQSSTTFHHDRNIANHKECQSTVLEMALTLGGHQDDDDEYAKEFYGSMIHVIHLMEIDLDGDRLYMSKAVCGYDLIRQGVSCRPQHRITNASIYHVRNSRQSDEKSLTN